MSEFYQISKKDRLGKITKKPLLIILIFVLFVFLYCLFVQKSVGLFFVSLAMGILLMLLLYLIIQIFFLPKVIIEVKEGKLMLSFPNRLLFDVNKIGDNELIGINQEGDYVDTFRAIIKLDNIDSVRRLDLSEVKKIKDIFQKSSGISDKDLSYSHFCFVSSWNSLVEISLKKVKLRYNDLFYKKEVILKNHKIYLSIDSYSEFAKSLND